MGCFIEFLYTANLNRIEPYSMVKFHLNIVDNGLKKLDETSQ